MATADGSTELNVKLVLRPLLGLMQGKTVEEVERFAVAELEKHRRLREEAARLETRRHQTASDDDRIIAETDYITAMIAMHAQQTVVSTLLDILGHVPKGVSGKYH